MIEICAFCDNPAEYQLQTEQRIRNGTMKEIFAVCKECYMVLAKTPLTEKQLEELK